MPLVSLGCPVSWPTPAEGVALDILVEHFTGIELTVRWRRTDGSHEYARAATPWFFGTMHGMAIDDQEDPSRGLTDQLVHEIDKHRCAEAFLKHHEAGFLPIGDRRDHVAATALPRAGDHGSLAPAAMRSAGHMVRSQAHLIRPVDRGFRKLSPPTNRCQCSPESCQQFSLDRLPPKTATPSSRRSWTRGEVRRGRGRVLRLSFPPRWIPFLERQLSKEGSCGTKDAHDG